MKLRAVVVNYKTAHMTAQALAALAPALRAIAASRALVVHDDSADGSYEALCASVAANGWTDLVQVVRSDRNGGFGYGNNYGVRPALASQDPPEYVYILNSDAFPEPGSVRT